MGAESILKELREDQCDRDPKYNGESKTKDEALRTGRKVKAMSWGQLKGS